MQTITDEKMRRLEQLIEAATEVFSKSGYRRTTMADIAREMAVSPGTLYLYVASKEALFDLAIRWHLGYVQHPDPQLSLPYETPGLDCTLAFLEKNMRVDILAPTLKCALTAAPPEDSRSELNYVINELYDMMARYRRAIRLLESSSMDSPELGRVFSDLRRDLMRAIAGYIEARSDSGAFAAVGNPRAVARFIMEYVGSFSMGQWDDLRLTTSDADGRQVCINMLLRALLP